MIDTSPFAKRLFVEQKSPLFALSLQRAGESRVVRSTLDKTRLTCFSNFNVTNDASASPVVFIETEWYIHCCCQDIPDLRASNGALIIVTTPNTPWLVFRDVRFTFYAGRQELPSTCHPLAIRDSNSCRPVDHQNLRLTFLPGDEKGDETGLDR